MSSIGVKFDQDKPAMGLLPARAVEEEAYVWGMGAKKYSAHNWRGGLTILRICGAILRHTFAIMRGEDIDPESGRHHGAHIRCDAAMLVEFYYEGRKELDDRYKTAPKQECPVVSDFAERVLADVEGGYRIVEGPNANNR